MLDTTVLVYAVGAEHRLRDPCRALIHAIGEGSVSATTTVAVLQEFAHVRSRRVGRADGAAVARAYSSLLAPLLVIEEADLRAGLDLFVRHDAVGAFDAVLAAATINRSAALVSADRGFSAVRAMTLHDPAAPDFLERLRVGPV